MKRNSGRPSLFRTLARIAFAASLAAVGTITVGGCAGLTLGPRTKTDIVMVGVGRPIQILETAEVRGRALEDDAIVEGQNIGGWVAMPREHYDEMMRAALSGEWAE